MARAGICCLLLADVELLKSVILNINAYWLSSFQLPVGTMRRIEQIMANFLWKNKLHGVCWEDVCKTEKEGGLGLRWLRDLGEAASFKRTWRCIQDESSIWACWMRQRYLRTRNFFDVGEMSTHSVTWKNILRSTVAFGGYC